MVQPEVLQDVLQLIKEHSERDVQEALRELRSYNRCVAEHREVERLISKLESHQEHVPFFVSQKLRALEKRLNFLTANLEV